MMVELWSMIIKGSKEPTHGSASRKSVNTEVGQKTRKFAVAQVDFIFSKLLSKAKNEPVFSMLKLATDAKLYFCIEF